MYFVKLKNFICLYFTVKEGSVEAKKKERKFHDNTGNWKQNKNEEEYKKVGG